jgi:hypothetical protein
MSSPLELIKDGIETGDWGLVTKGYNVLTGQKLAVPQPPAAGKDLSDEDAIYLTITILQDILEERAAAPVQVQAEPPPKTTSPAKKKVVKKKTASKKKVTKKTGVKKGVTKKKTAKKKGDDDSSDDTDNVVEGNTMIGKFRLPFADYIDPAAEAEAKAAASRRQPKQRNTPYKPHPVGCEKCSKEFDGKKAAHQERIILEKDDNDRTIKSVTYKCPFCRNEQQGKLV